eukprot:CAMPEP_0170178278 /NCGR_PEP_ID=MMETSP0040_2-20121228/11779_1 /TAXON_ID=641309 /ORGANISM="Lotharella oceanica, Strain CCMP622" /LENGTH=218 /DNA_ID=CAMNT_0010421289 /DNA_START=104 /DNA_END=760 /DNA_ORIENTATION=+
MASFESKADAYSIPNRPLTEMVDLKKRVEEKDRTRNMLLHKPRHCLSRNANTENEILYAVRLPGAKRQENLALGYPRLPLQDAKDDAGDEHEQLDDKVVLFLESQARSSSLYVSVLIAIAISLCISIVAFAAGTPSGRSPARLMGDIFLSCLGVIGIRYKNTHILTLFISFMYVEAFISAVALSTMLDFTSFLAKLGVCNGASHVQASLMPTWFSPVH